MMKSSSSSAAAAAGCLDHSLSVEEKAQHLYRGVALGPMVRASTTPLRIQALTYGADFCYTEELVDRAVTGTIRQVNTILGTVDYVKDTSHQSEKVKRRLANSGPALFLRINHSKERGKLVCQLGTGEPEFALPAAQHVCQDIDAIDINMGCPKKFSISGGMGSALLDDPDRASRILRTLRNGLPETPVSCKIRLLKSTQATLDFCHAMVNAGALAIAIHARTIHHEATQAADWKTLKEVVPLLKAKYPSVPVLVNGDFYTRQEWMDVMNDTGANGVLLARPALYNMSLFKQPTPEQAGPFGYDSPLLLDKTTVIQDYLKECVRYEMHYKNVKYNLCEMMTHRRAPISRVNDLPQTYTGGQTIAKVSSCHSIEELCKVWDVKASFSNKVTTTPSLPAGDHRYEDSYLLKLGEEKKASEDDEPLAKRNKTEREGRVLDEF